VAETVITFYFRQEFIMTQYQQFNQQPGDPKRDARAQAMAEKAYRKAQRPWFKKKRVIVPLALVVIIGIGSVAGGGGEDAPDAAVTPSPAVAANDAGQAAEPAADPVPAEPAQPAEPAAPAFPGAEESDVVGQAGESLTLGDVTVAAAALTPGDATLGPTLCTAVTVTNGADETIDFNALDWKLQAPSGTILNTGFIGSSTMITAGQIAPGGTTSGDVCFDAEGAGAGQFVVLYEPIFSFFSDRAAWVNNR
jgi:hypothetical protein